MTDPVEARPFGVRFQEAIDYLKGKLPESTLTSSDLAGPVHGKVFAVAGAVKTDLVSDIQASLVQGLTDGTTITDFRKQFDQAVQKHGWSYKGKRGWRTAVIFDNNMRSAHMAGRWAQLQAGKDRRPYLQYRTAGDARVRPQHRQWNLKIFHIDDPFWQTHYPPNGWNCRCTIRAYSERDLERKNLQVSEPFQMDTREVVTRDGEITDVVPVGIDPSWDHNVGQSWIAPEMALGRKLARLPRQLQGIVVDKTITPAFQTVLSDNFKAFRTSVKAASKPDGSAQIVGFLDSATLNGLAREVPDLALESTAVTVLDRRTLHLEGVHKQASNPAQVWSDTQINVLPADLRDYQAVLWDAVDQVLVIVPTEPLQVGKGATRWAKVVLRPNVKTKFGQAVSVVSLGSAQARNLSEARYVPLVGHAPKN
ncbi:MAG: phage minor head protein [Comamonas sp.]